MQSLMATKILCNYKIDAYLIPILNVLNFMKNRKLDCARSSKNSIPKYEVYRPFKIDSVQYRKLHATFQSLHEAIHKVMVKLYAEDAQRFVDEHLRQKHNRIICPEEMSDEVTLSVY